MVPVVDNLRKLEFLLSNDTWRKSPGNIFLSILTLEFASHDCFEMRLASDRPCAKETEGEGERPKTADNQERKFHGQTAYAWQQSRKSPNQKRYPKKQHGQYGSIWCEVSSLSVLHKLFTMAPPN